MSDRTTVYARQKLEKMSADLVDYVNAYPSADEYIEHVMGANLKIIEAIEELHLADLVTA